jgi:hypothetical protein
MVKPTMDSKSIVITAKDLLYKAGNGLKHRFRHVTAFAGRHTPPRVKDAFSFAAMLGEEMTPEPLRIIGKAAKCGPPLTQAAFWGGNNLLLKPGVALAFTGHTEAGLAMTAAGMSTLVYSLKGYSAALKRYKPKPWEITEKEYESLVDLDY